MLHTTAPHGMSRVCVSGGFEAAGHVSPVPAVVSLRVYPGVQGSLPDV